MTRRICIAIMAGLLGWSGCLLGQTPGPSSAVPSPGGGAPRVSLADLVACWVAHHKEDGVGEVRLKKQTLFGIRRGDKTEGYVNVRAGVPVKVVEVTDQGISVQFGNASARVPAADTDLAERWTQRHGLGEAAPEGSPAVPAPVAAVAAVPAATPTPLPSATPTPVAAGSPDRSGYIWVNGYTRKNGTYVSGHWRKKSSR